MTILQTTYALLTTAPRVTDATLERIAQAYRIRSPGLAALWTPVYPDATALPVRLVSSVAELLDGDIPVVGSRTIDLPSALAYHTQQDGRAYGLVLCDEYQTDESIVIAWLHEMFEAQVDRMCDRYLAGVAAEVQDPTQGQRADVDLGSGDPVPCCASVTPAWFGGAAGPGLDAGPTTTAGLRFPGPLTVAPEGYFQREDGSQVMGMRRVHPAHHLHFHGRPAKRNRALGKRIGLIR